MSVFNREQHRIAPALIMGLCGFSGRKFDFYEQFNFLFKLITIVIKDEFVEISA